MGIRNFHLLGKAYSETGDVSISVSIAGYGEIFNGVVPTMTVPTPEECIETPNSLATWATDDEVAVSAKDLTIVVTGGDVFIISNGADKFNRNDLTEIVDFTDVEAKTNVMLDGVSYEYSNDIAADGGIEGWHVLVHDGETLTFTMTASTIPPNLPGGIWPTDVNHDAYTRAIDPQPVSYAGKMTPSYEEGDARPEPVDDV